MAFLLIMTAAAILLALISAALLESSDVFGPDRGRRRPARHLPGELADRDSANTHRTWRSRSEDG